MRKNHFANMVNYIKKVFNVEKSISRLTDGRKISIYTIGEVILPALTGFLIRVRGFNALNNMIKENEFKNVLQKGMKLPKIDIIRDTLKVIDINGLRKILKNCHAIT